MSKQGLWLLVLLALYFAYEKGVFTEKTTSEKTSFLQLVESQTSGQMVEVEARVYKILEDDLKGDKHQRFLVDVAGVSVLVAHNIDLAPRVPIKENDVLLIKGQYEWNDKGGVLHWTHHDPQKRHEEGWIIYAGKKFN